MTKVMIGCRCLPSPVLKDAGGWEDRLLGRKRGTMQVTPSGSREAKVVTTSPISLD